MSQVSSVNKFFKTTNTAYEAANTIVGDTREAPRIIPVDPTPVDTDNDAANV